jgi:hypothetical protein
MTATCGVVVYEIRNAEKSRARCDVPQMLFQAVLTTLTNPDELMKALD